MSEVLGYRGSVNSWECDENDHLNVRFHVERHWQTLQGALPDLGIETIGIDETNLAVQHLRFLAEVRAAEPMAGVAAVLATPQGHGLAVLTELRQAFSGRLFSSCVHVLPSCPNAAGIDLPDHAGPRGVADRDLPHVGLAMGDCEAYGFFNIGAGVVQPYEVGADGRLQLHQYMGRVSDSMPNLWASVAHPEAFDPEGGAVLEYRLRYHHPLGAGDRYRLYSGLAGVSSKVQSFSHLLFNADSGALCVSAAAASVRMDLVARKALALPEQLLSQMRLRIVRPA